MEDHARVAAEKYEEPKQLNKAWSLTREITGFNKWTLFYGFLVLLFYAFLIYLWQGLEALMEELPLILIQGILAAGLAFVALYFINLVRAPYLINGEQIAVIRKLESELIPERISARITVEANVYQTQYGTHYAAIRFTNENQRTVFLKGLPKGIFHDTDGFSENLLDKFNAYESKLGWKGGSKEGTKMIEHGVHRSLDIALIDDQKLKWLFGEDTSEEAPTGTYKFHITVMGDMGGRLVEPIEFTGRLEYTGGDKLSFREWSEDEETAQEISGQP